MKYSFMEVGYQIFQSQLHRPEVVARLVAGRIFTPVRFSPIG